MTVGELMAKLAALPPSTVVVTDDDQSFGYFTATAYTFRGRVKREGSWTDVSEDNGRDDTETVLLISAFGHDMEEL